MTRAPVTVKEPTRFAMNNNRESRPRDTLHNPSNHLTREIQVFHGRFKEFPTNTFKCFTQIKL